MSLGWIYKWKDMRQKVLYFSIWFIITIWQEVELTLDPGHPYLFPNASGHSIRSPPGPLTKAQPNMAKMKRSAPTLTWATPDTTSARKKLLSACLDVGMFESLKPYKLQCESFSGVFELELVMFIHLLRILGLTHFETSPALGKPWRHLKRSAFRFGCKDLCLFFGTEHCNAAKYCTQQRLSEKVNTSERLNKC